MELKRLKYLSSVATSNHVFSPGHATLVAGNCRRQAVNIGTRQSDSRYVRQIEVYVAIDSPLPLHIEVLRIIFWHRWVKELDKAKDMEIKQVLHLQALLHNYLDPVILA